MRQVADSGLIRPDLTSERSGNVLFTALPGHPRTSGLVAQRIDRCFHERHESASPVVCRIMACRTLHFQAVAPAGGRVSAVAVELAGIQHRGRPAAGSEGRGGRRAVGVRSDQACADRTPGKARRAVRRNWRRPLHSYQSPPAANYCAVLSRPSNARVRRGQPAAIDRRRRRALPQPSARQASTSSTGSTFRTVVASVAARCQFTSQSSPQHGAPGRTVTSAGSGEPAETGRRNSRCREASRRSENF